MGSKTTEDVISEIKRSWIEKLAISGKRVDNRGPEEFRPIKVIKGFVEKAEGSALVSIGRTTVLVGVKIEIGQPFPDTPDKGVIITNAELIPLAAPTFEPGPPGEEGIELARVVDRGIRESEMIDLSELVIEEGEKVWIVYIDIDVLNYEGNLFDVSSLAAVAALLNAKIPFSKHDMGEDKPLPIKHVPVSVTWAKVGSAILVDPSYDEESIMSARLTVVTDEEGNVRAMQKGGEGSFTLDEVKKIIKKSAELGSRIRKQYLEVG